MRRGGVWYLSAFLEHGYAAHMHTTQLTGWRYQNSFVASLHSGVLL